MSVKDITSLTLVNVATQNRTAEEWLPVAGFGEPNRTVFQPITNFPLLVSTTLYAYSVTYANIHQKNLSRQ